MTVIYLQELIRYMKQFAIERASNSPWIIGRGWNQDFFEDETRMPNRYTTASWCVYWT